MSRVNRGLNFLILKTTRYPRIRLAIEHNHKEFVGHMYCQQMLRQGDNFTNILQAAFVHA